MKCVHLVIFGTLLISVIDMMVDPDGTLDALSNLSLTSPLTDQKLNPGTQQGASVVPHGAGISSDTMP